MCEPTTIVLAASTVLSGVQQYQEGEFNKDVSRYNSATLRNETVAVQNRATQAENAERRKTAELISRQRAQIAANGADVNSGSPFQLQEDSAALGEINAMRIRQAGVDQVGAMNDQADFIDDQGNAASRMGRTALGTSLLTAAAGVGFKEGGIASKWFNSDSAANALITDAVPTVIMG